MGTMSWVKGVVVAVGLSLGGSAVAAGPAPVVVEYQSAGLYDRQRPHDFDRDRWDDGWLDDRNDRNDRMSRHERRLFRQGQKKIADGKALQLRGERMLQRARWNRSPVMARQAHRLIVRGEQLERDGRILIRRARS